MRRIGKVIILLFISVVLVSCGKKSYVIFDYNCNGSDYHKCELKNNKLNCRVMTPKCGEYTFKGWYRANEYNNPVDLTSNFKINEIIYARWDKGEIVEPSSSEEPTSTIVTPGIIDMPSSSKEEPSSSKEPSSSQQQLVDPPKPEETYTISFNLNGGIGGQTTTINGVKYNDDLPTINQNKPSKPGYTFTGWYDKQNGGTQYYNSSNSPVRKYDKKGNITLHAQWKVNVLSIEYNGNGGTWNSSNAKFGANSSGTVILKSTNKTYQQVLNYGEKLESSGLVDYNGSWFKWTRSGYTVESKKEYIIGSTVLDQSKVYSSIELSRYGGCDLSKKSCTITVKVNWIDSPLASSGRGRDIVASKELKTACQWVINQELVKIRLRTCTEESGKRYQNASAELPGGAYTSSNGTEDIAKETIPLSEYAKGVFFGEENVDIAPDSRYAFMIIYRTVILHNTVHYAISAKRDPVYNGEEIMFRAGSCAQNYRNTRKKLLYDSGQWKKEIDDTQNVTKYLILADTTGETTNASYRSYTGIEQQIEKAGRDGKNFVEILEEVIKSGNQSSHYYKNAKVYDCRNLLESGDIEYVVK